MTSQDNSDVFTKFHAGDAYQNMSTDEIKIDMDQRYKTGDAYPNLARWIHAHHRELEQVFVQYLSTKTKDKRILELGCGSGGVAAHNISDSATIIATDLSDIALNTARDFFACRSDITFLQMDASNIIFPDSSFDIVIAKEVIEHLKNPSVSIQDVCRVLCQGGYFVLSSPNRDSLHLRLNRKLGRQDFPCAGDHIYEFTYSEMTGLLTRCGFDVVAAEGVTLMPYHYVEGVFPDPVRHLEDSDEEFVEWLRELGRRSGPEFAFCYVILARKSG